ncbi:MAG: hypothetical protein SVX43_02460 [Cyanobacteriota bacterium]|nr:hypothetical protein [Cyanobacteriota bacterium]
MQSPVIALQNINANSSVAELWTAAKVCLQMGRFNQSLTLAYRAVQQDPSQQQQYQIHYLETVRLAAEFAEEIEDYPRAAYYWEQVTQQQPQNADAWYGLGLAKANLQDYPGAQGALTRCVQLQPGNERARSHLQEIQQILGI